MATLKRTRAAQRVMAAQFEFNIANGDQMLNSSGVLTLFRASAGVFDIIPLTPGWRVVGGDLNVKVVSNDSSTATISVGDSGSATRYLGATSIKAAARTALTPTIFVSGGEPIRVTLANAGGDATTGKVTITVLFVKEGAADEAIGSSSVAL